MRHTIEIEKNESSNKASRRLRPARERTKEMHQCREMRWDNDNNNSMNTRTHNKKVTRVVEGSMPDETEAAAHAHKCNLMKYEGKFRTPSKAMQRNARDNELFQC